MSGREEHNQREASQDQAGFSLSLEIPVGTGLAGHGELRVGDLCPRCAKAHVDYDGLLNLVCPACGDTSGGCFT